MTIEIHDNDANITFAEIELDPVQLGQALGRLGFTKCKINLHLSNRIGKKMENKTFEFKIPNDLGYSNDKKNIVIKIAEEKCPIGWIPDTSFSSRGSFFSKDGQNWARTTIRRWV